MARHDAAHAPEVLESRLALAFDVTITPLTTSPATFAYNITVDDLVDTSGFGRDVYMSRLDSGARQVKVADNPALSNATTLGLDLVGYGACTTFYVTSGGNAKSVLAALNPVSPTDIPINGQGTYEFTLADKSSSLPGVNPLSVQGQGSLTYTDPATSKTYNLGFSYSATALTAYSSAAITVTTGTGNWSGSGLTPFGRVVTDYSPLTQSIQTTVFFWFTDSNGGRVQLDDLTVVNSPYKYFDPAPAHPQSFTVVQGQNMDQRLIVDLPAVGSRISINNNWNAKLGDEVNDPLFYSAYDGTVNAGQIALYATDVSINQDISSVSQVSIGGPRNIFTRLGDLDSTSTDILNVSSIASIRPIGLAGGTFVTGPGIQPDTVVTDVDPFTNTVSMSAPPTITQNNVSLQFVQPRPSGYIRDMASLRVLGRVASPSYNITVAATPPSHGEVFVSQAGALTGLGGDAASSVALTAQYTDVRLEGAVAATSLNFFLNAPGSADQYVLTTRSSTTGSQTGLVSGGTLAVTLGQPAGGTVDLATALDHLRFDSGVGSNGAPFRYTVAIEDKDDLTVDSVAASSGPISLASATGKLSIKGAAVRTTGDLTVAAATSLSFDGSVSSSNGNVTLVSPTLSLGSSVTAGGARGVSLQSKTGPSTINALVQAGGQLKTPVRVATTAPIDLTTGGLLTIDGVTLTAGDRVLVKNQSSATENGIYVVSAGSWIRATDANTSALLVPGFVTFAIEGQTQKGGWVFQNPANPILGQTGTGLAFVPVTATLAYGPAKAATTGAIDLTTNGLTAVDGVTLAEGDRVLVKNQPNQADNGIYLASVGPWVRASDADTTAELRAGSYVFITSGTTNGGQGFALLNDAVQVGTTDLRFGDFLVESQRSNFWSPSNTIGSVRVATTVNLEALTGLLTIDGVKLVAGDRVLVKNQITPSANGVYLAAAGAWTRASDASLGANFAYDTFVYVSEGTVGRGTGWLVDNSIVMTATLTADSNLLTGLRSTEGLTIGMAVEGEGIPAGSTITGLGADGTSVFLSQNAIATVTLSLVRFASFTNPTVGVTPLVFRATGGNVSVASAGDISGSPTQGRLQGQNVVLTAGTGGTGLINTKTTASTISAVAPGSITLDNASQVELADVRSGTAADVVVLSAGTLTATSVAAGGNVSLSSTYGDVVAGRVGSTVGTISLSSLVSNTAIANATGTARVAAQNGSVIARADKGAVIVNGQVAAQGTGSDVSFISNYISNTASDPAALRFGPLADVSASDQLIIDTPNSMPVVDPLAKLTAARLSLRSKLFGNTAPPTSLGSYPSVLINRTDAGDINYTSLSSLTVEGATTVNGSIAFTAPDLRVTGGIATVGVNTDVTLTASTNNLFVDGTVTSQRDVYLNAVGGSITNSTAGRTALITAPRNVIVAADKTATVLTKAQALTASLTGVGGTLDVQDDDGLVITSAVLSGGGNATFKIGTAALGGSTLVGLIDVGPNGTVSIDSYGDIVESTVDPTADIVAKSATFKSANGRIDLDTTVDVLTASTLQKTAPITLRDQGTGTTPLQLTSLTGVGTGADITVTSARTIQATAVTTAGRVNLTTTSPAASVQVGTVTATGNTATIAAAGNIEKLTPAALITATSVVLDSASGSIDAMLAASNAAAATGAGGAISLQDADSLSIGNDLLARGISTTGLVTITVGNALTQSQSIVGQSLVATSTGGVITLTNANNDVDSLTMNNGNRAVSFTDKDDLSIASIVGGPITLAVGGNLAQTGPITGTTLGITASAGTVSLTNPGNDVDSLSVNDGIRAVSFTDKDDLLINGVGIIGGTIAVTAGTALVVASPVTAGTSTAGDGDITLTSNAGSISLAATLTAKADKVTLNASSGTITQTAGIIDSLTLVWYAQSLPTPNPLAGSYSIVGPNLTAAGNLVLAYATPITIAGASTVNGTITITAPSVRIIDTVKTAAGNAVSVTATSGGIEFAEQLGGIVTSPSGAVTLSATSGAITATNKASRTTVRGGPLTVTAQSADLKINVQSFSSTVTSGGLTVSAVDGLSLGGISATGQTVTLAAASGITQQTGSIAASTLAVTNGAGAVALTAATNNVSIVSIVNGSGDVSFVNAGTFSVVAPGVSTGSATTGDGNVSLKSVRGSIALNANVAAPGDRVTLDARNGTISQQASTSITSQSLVWYAQSAPSLAGSYSSVGANLTAVGSLVLGPYTQPITITGATTVNGDITVTAPEVVITDPVIAGGVGHSITVTATNGSIGVQSKGLLQTTGGPISLSATGAITAANAASVTTITGSDLAISAGGPATLSTSSIGLGNVSVNGLLTLTTKGALTQKPAATIQAEALDITGAGNAITLANVGNNVGTLSVNNGAGAVRYRDTSELVIDTIVGGAVTLVVGTPIVAGPSLSQTASGSITATTLDITSTARGVQLSNVSNDVGTLSVSNPGRVVSFTDKNDLVVNGITGGTTTLTVGGKLTQTNIPITCSQLVVISTATQNGGVLLNTAVNDVDTLSVSNPGRRFIFTDVDDLSLAGIAADSTTLNVGGNLTQSSQIVGNSLTVAATAGSVTLTNAANSVAAASISNGNRAVSFVNASALSLGGLTMGTGSLTVGGDLTQTGPMTGSSLSITSTAGTINLLNSANNLDALTVSNGSRLFSYADSSSVAITSVGTLSVGTVTAPQQLTVTTTNGGSVDVGPQANGLLQSGGTLDLRAVQGSIGMRNNGRIIGNPILLPPGMGIQVGGAITTPTELNTAISTINSLAPIAGGTYEILVASSMTLTQQLAVSRPITFRGTSQSIVLSGSSSVTNGLLLDSGASGSTIRDIAFSSFSGDAIRMTSATGITIKGIQANNSGNGLSINGTSTNTVVQGNTFDRDQTGVSLVSATGALVGGMDAGQGNVISSAVRQGVFASGFCTGSQVVKNTFPGTATPYNVSASRNLTIIN